MVYAFSAEVFNLVTYPANAYNLPPAPDLDPAYLLDESINYSVKYLHDDIPAILPYTTQSNNEFPPNLFFPWTPPIASPVANNPYTGLF